MAIHSGNLTAVEFLLKNGADCKSKEGMGWSGAHFAALHNKPAILKVSGLSAAVSRSLTNRSCSCSCQALLDAGCPVDNVNMSHETPLMIACSHGHIDIIRMLLRDYSARTNVVDWKGKKKPQLLPPQSV